MKTIKIVISSIAVALLLSACGGGDMAEGGTNSSSSTIKVIACDNSNAGVGVNDCGNSLVPNYYTCIEEGDTLVEETDATNVEIIHNVSEKKVCVNTGVAHLIREN